ncbi:MAG: GFA family protein [Gammaproteobacteria bacterium]|nr:GFA family protein [Gammaproteobacteria bacterium]
MKPERCKTGGCQCGAIRYELIGMPKMLYACHCSDCQKQSASAFGMSLIMDPREIEISQGAERLQSWDTQGDDGAIKRCSFCPECGTRILHGSDNPLEQVSIKAGSLDDTSDLRPIAHIWLKSAQPWISVDPGLYQCFDEEPENLDGLRKLWQAQHGDN